MKEKKHKDKKGVYYVLLLILAGLIISGIFLYRYQEENHELELHKRLLMDRLAGAVSEYKFIKTENDSLREVIEQDRQSILNLMDSVSSVTMDSRDKLLSFEESFRLMKDEIVGLRIKVDSLQSINDSLELTNSNIASKSSELQNSNRELRDSLVKNSYLKIKSLRVDAINEKWSGKQEITHDNFWADLLRICFGVGNNELTQKGLKTIHIRIVTSGNKVLSGEEQYLVLGDSSIAYSREESFIYTGEARTECLDIAADSFEEGEYRVEIYYDKKLQAVSSLLLD